MIVLKALLQGGALYLRHCDDSSQTVLEHHRYHLYTISICVDSSRTVLEHHRYHLPIYFLISFFRSLHVLELMGTTYGVHVYF